MISGFSSRNGIKTARMANAKNPNSATGHAKCGLKKVLTYFGIGSADLKIYLRKESQAGEVA